MHEVGIAMAVAVAIDERGLDPAAVRLIVASGDHDPDDFEAALRAQLEAIDAGGRNGHAPGSGRSDPRSDPRASLAAVRIVRAPTAWLCSGCGDAYRALAPDPGCPRCGGAGLAVDQRERVELEWDGLEAEDGAPVPGQDGPDRPTEHDTRPSLDSAPGPDAGNMRRPVVSRRP